MQAKNYKDRLTVNGKPQRQKFSPTVELKTQIAKDKECLSKTRPVKPREMEWHADALTKS